MSDLLANPQTVTAASGARAHDWFGQPRGLTILFLTETWEKFSFFGMRALLIYYMTRHLDIEQAHASYIYGVYGAAVYFTPIIGGMLADRWLGRRRAVMLGGAIMAVGHFMMTSESLFYPALVVIACGNGLFLPSLPSQIEALYAKDDPRRTSGYSIYYVGINLGAFLAPLVCGTLGERFGWHWGFSAAGVGMILGLFIYRSGLRYLPSQTVAVSRSESARAGATEHGPPASASRTWPLLAAVAVVAVVFRAAYEQAGNTVALWVGTDVDRMIGGGWEIPMTWFLSLNPLVVFLLTPVVVAHWTRRAARGRDQTPLTKMAIGALVVALSYLLLAGVCAQGGNAAWPWAAAFFVILTIGELYILPIGLALFGRLAPGNRTATSIAAWFLALSAGNLLGGAVGSLWSQLTPATFFTIVAAIACVAALMLKLLDRSARRLATSSTDARTGVRT
jgi:proton-dependent oligopeptide transporter, POT family